ncbi:2-keto-4-pentenoate hydratase [Nonomuraea gerenzanensis]|uniref:4-oxalocrotonate decarboxylase n=1 Tax=Nonomuraea gerenzanensis TaxID=93944 RepID=A0A1M4EC91_9ACTN|nr:fumarylacetoacetate hydrolase family protein [Nonomuraea gerenzanensis]UBU18729.1 fumarylacetoacetate hydrolase family protein [Nonomuraea gerenzanensis]SBO96591.1 4-oxalocrotonate decarboxylase [Nonomuraea gerenzanensis]
MNALAELLDEATLTARAIPRLTDTADLDVPAAYQVQRATVERRLARGERIIGVKMGFTSRAKMVQMGVNDVIWGLLTDAMLVQHDLDTAGLIHPRIEPEIAFLLERPVRTPADAAAAVGGVAVGYEVLDSRYEGFSFTLADVIADNASASGFGHGPWHRPRDVANLGLVMEIDGRAVASGSSAAILGDPLRSLTAAARLASAAGIELQPGWVVLAGAATAAVPLPAGAHVRIAAAGLGHVEVTTR